MSPYLAYGDIYRFFAMLAGSIWMGAELLKKRGIIVHPTWPTIVSVIYIIYISLLSNLLPDYRVSENLQSFILLFFLIIYESRRKEILTLLPVYVSILLFTPIWMFQTFREITSGNEYAARMLSHSSDVAAELSSQGVGGYGLIYSVMLLLPILVSSIRNFKKIDLTKLRSIIKSHSAILLILLLTNLVMGILLIIYAGYSIAIIIVVLSIAPALLINRINSKQILLSIIILTVAFVVMQIFLDDVIGLINDKSTTSLYLNKISDIYDTVHGGKSAGTFADRSERYYVSLFEFFKYPIFGTSNLNNIGGHSTYLDGFARFGFLAGLSLILLLTYVPFRFFRIMRFDMGLPLSVIITALIFPLINTVPASFGVMLFIVFPVTCGLLLNYSENSKTR